MVLLPNNLYHIYNQGNNKQTLFFDDKDYEYFLKNVEECLKPHCNILSYCLMPNHFHFLLDITEKSVIKMRLGGIEIDNVTNAFRKILSNYTQQHFNQKYNQSGSLFRQKTKGKCLSCDNLSSYGFICFQYIHQNPYKANLVQKLEDWEFSSFKDYAGLRNNILCNQDLAFQYINLSKTDFYNESYNVIDEVNLKNIFQ